jgi:uncharacterized repeat protein (TIGR03803 family)
MTYNGGANNYGVIFQYDSTTNTYTKKIDLATATGSYPRASLVQGSDGKFYGMTTNGGVNSVGVIFQYDSTTNTYTKKIDLASAIGVYPYGSLVQGSDGKFYGMTFEGGANNYGVIFQYDSTTNIYTDKIDFTYSNGSSPLGSLVQGSDGKFYGMTSTGGVNYNGIIFQYYPTLPVIPTVTTPTAETVGVTTVTLGANVTSLGVPASISARGTCYGTSPAPTTNCVAASGTTTGVFTQARTGLTANTFYYFRGYATNTTGTAYSPDGVFFTGSYPTVALTYTKNLTGTGTQVITATYSKAIDTSVSLPKVSINQQGSTDITNALMTSAGGNIYTYAYTVNPANGSTYKDGVVAVSLSATTDLFGNSTSAPTNNSFTIDTTGPSVVLSYSSNTIGTGTQVITATYSGVVTGAPMISIDQPGSTDITNVLMSGSGSTRTYSYIVNKANGSTYIDGTATVSLTSVLDALGKPTNSPTNTTFTINTTSSVDVALTYSANPAHVGTNTITATYSGAITGTPTISIDQPGSTDISNASMVAPENGVTWTGRSASEANAWKSVAYGNGIFVAVSDSGINRVMTSTHGITWTPRILTGVSSGCNSVTYGNGLFVILCGYANVPNILTSSDGITWTPRTSAKEASDWRSVIYGNNTFVAVSASDAVMTSPDGVTWTLRRDLGVNGWRSVTYGNGLFVAVSWNGDSRFMTSPDGINWSLKSSNNGGALASITYGNGLFVAVNQYCSITTCITTSPDGTNWTYRTTPEANTFESITYGNGTFVAVSSSGTNRVITSTDGITWTARSASEANAWTSVTYGNGVFVAVSSSGTNRVMTSFGGGGYSYNYTVHPTNGTTYINGTAKVSLYGVTDTSGDPSGRPVNAPTNDTFLIDTAGPAVVLSYTNNPTDVGTQTITATYNKAITGTPTISIDQQGSTDITNAVMTSGGGAQAGWYGTSGWGYRTKITIDHTKVPNTNQTDFPILIKKTDVNWKNIANSGHVGQADGGDILFTSSNGTTKLNHEIEKYTVDTGEVIAWVKIPILTTATDTDIYMYYGNASVADQWNISGVWDSSYKGVWHLPSATTILDSSSNTNNGTNNGMTDTSSGKIGGAVATSSSSISVTGTNFPSGAQPVTISGWFNPATLSSGYGTIFEIGEATVLDKEIVFYNHGTTFGAGSTGAAIEKASALAIGNWYYGTATYNGTQQRAYLNGTELTGSPTSRTYNIQTNRRLIGNDNYSDYFNGSIDEIRVSNVARSADWIKTEYNNQDSPSTFYSTSSEESSATSVYTYVYTVHIADGTTYKDGIAIVSLSSVTDADGNVSSLPTNDNFVINTSGVGLNVALAYTSDPAPVGTQRIRAIYSKEITSIPNISINPQGSEKVTNVAMNAPASVWTAGTSIESNTWLSVTYGNGLFVAVSVEGEVMISTDGVIWTAGTASTSALWSSVAYGNGSFVAVAQNGSVMKSSNGIDWTTQTPSSFFEWNSITYGNGIFVAVSSNGTNRVMTSIDGVTWAERTTPEENIWISVVYGNGTFVAVAYDSDKAMTSIDGINWNIQTVAESGLWKSVVYGNDIFVAVSNDGLVMTSTDGATWTSQTAVELNQWRSVTYGNGIFVAVAYDGTHRVMTSLDGITWQAYSSSEQNNWQSITYGNNLFVAVSSDGTSQVMNSSDSYFYDYTVVKANGVEYIDGLATVSLSTVKDESNNDSNAPTNNTFTIRTSSVFGTLTSSVFDTADSNNIKYNSIMWKGTLGGDAVPPIEGKVRFQIATSANADGSWIYRGGDTCQPGTWFETTGPDSPVELKGSCSSGQRYFRYKVQICSHDCIDAGEFSPTVQNVIVNWSP